MILHVKPGRIIMPVGNPGAQTHVEKEGRDTSHEALQVAVAGSYMLQIFRSNSTFGGPPR